MNLDIGQGSPITYKPVDTRPIKVDESEFKTAVAQNPESWQAFHEWASDYRTCPLPEMLRSSMLDA